MFNARRLKNTFSDLEALAVSDDFHIIGVSESWINTENRDFLAEYNLLIIQCLAVNGKIKKKGGGVVIYVLASLNSMVLQTEKIDNVDVVF